MKFSYSNLLSQVYRKGDLKARLHISPSTTKLFTFQWPSKSRSVSTTFLFFCETLKTRERTAISIRRIMVMAAIGMHVHWSVIGARQNRIPAFITIVLIIAHKCIYIVISLNQVMVVKAPTNRTGESIWENRVPGTESLPNSCRTKRIRTYLKSCVSRTHCSLRL